MSDKSTKPTHGRKPRGVEISVSPGMIEQVLTEWEAEHPGRRADIDMGADEFVNRMMTKVRAAARIIPDA